MRAEPTDQHKWLQQLVGNWFYETTNDSGPGETPSIVKGRETVRALGELWTIGEGTMDLSDGTTATTILTIGYDPEEGAFVGSWIGSMMSKLWTYRGELDASGMILTLNSEGPSFSNDGTTAQYQDIITIISKDHRIFTSRSQNKDGTWNEFMKVDYYRTP